MSLQQLEIRKIQIKAIARRISHSLDWGNNNSDITKDWWGCKKWKQSSAAVEDINWYNMLRKLFVNLGQISDVHTYDSTSHMCIKGVVKIIYSKMF